MSNPPSDNGPSSSPGDAATVRSSAVAKLRRAASIPRNKDGRRVETPKASFPPTESVESMAIPPAVTVVEASPNGKMRERNEPYEQEHLFERDPRSDMADDHLDSYPSGFGGAENELGREILTEDDIGRPSHPTMPTSSTLSQNFQDEGQIERQQESDEHRPSRLPTLMQRSASSSSQNSLQYPQRFPTLPSLSDIQSRHLLQRSNSASARQDALSRLTGVPPPAAPSTAAPAKPIEPPLQTLNLSGSSQADSDSTKTTPSSNARPRLGRSFTIGGSHPGGERRSVVGRRMMARLGSRTDGGSSSSVSPSPVPVPPIPRSQSPSPTRLNTSTDDVASTDLSEGKDDGPDKGEQDRSSRENQMIEADREEILLPSSTSSARSAVFPRTLDELSNPPTFLERTPPRPFMSHGYSFSESLPSSRSGSPHPFPDYTRPSRLGSISITQPFTSSNSGRLSDASSLAFDRQWAPSPDTGEPADAFEFSDLLRSNSSRTARSVSPRPPVLTEGLDGRREYHLGAPPLPRSRDEGSDQVEILTSSTRSISSLNDQNNQFSTAVRTAPSIITTIINDSNDNDNHDGNDNTDNSNSNDGSSRDISKINSRSNASPSYYSTPTSDFSPSIPILPPGLGTNARGLGPDGFEWGNTDRYRTASADSFPASVGPRDDHKDHKAGPRSRLSSSPADEDLYQGDREAPGQDRFLTPLESVRSLSRPGSASAETERSSKTPSSALSGVSRDGSSGSYRDGDARSFAELDQAKSWVSVGDDASGSIETDKKYGHKKSLSFVEKLERLAKGTFRGRSSSSGQSSPYQARSPALETRDPMSPVMNRSLSKSTLHSSGSSSGQRRPSSNQTLEDRTSGMTLDRPSTSQSSVGYQAQLHNSPPTFGSRLPPPSPTETRYSDAKLMPFPGIVQLEKERDRKRERSIGSVSPSIDRYVPSDTGTPASYVSPFEVTGEFESTLSPGSSPVAYFDLSPRPPSPNSKKSWLSRKFSTGALKGSNEDRKKASNSPDDLARVIEGGMLGRELSASPRASPHSNSPASRFSSPKESSSLFTSTPHSPSPPSPRNSDPSRRSSRSSPPLAFVNTFPSRSTHTADAVHATSTTMPTLPKLMGAPLNAGLTTVAEPSEEGTPRPSMSSFDLSHKADWIHSRQGTIQATAVANERIVSLDEDEHGTGYEGAPSLLSLYSKESEGDRLSASLSQHNDQPIREQTGEQIKEMYQDAQKGAAPSLPHSFEPPAAPSLTLSPKTEEILGRLDSVLALASTQQSTGSQLSNPPRKLLLHSPVLQVVNANAAKDRYLFLFTDILVIAKPILTEGQMPSLDNKFIVKSIVDLPKLKLSGLKDGDATSDSMKKQHPIVLNFIQIFSQDPYRAVDYLISQSNLSSASISGFLFKTTELDRTKLGEFLSQEANEQLLEGFVARFAFAGVRIDEALRTFLLSIRLPTEANANERLLWTFAAQWHEVNAEVVPFSKQVSIQLVLAIMQLNDALNPSSSGFGTFAFANQAITVDDFIQAFRVHDSRRLVTNNYLESLYISIKQEKLSQALSSSESHLQRDIYLLPSQLPSKLTYMVPSEMIYITMPESDPNLIIRLHGTGLTFNPPVLNFARSSRASFTVTGTSLGAKTMLISRTGNSSPLYNSLPASKTFLVERAFQRIGHTFQLSFIREPTNQKRKYLISFESSTTRLHWAGSIQGQIQRSTAALEHNLKNGLLPISVQEAARTVALQVLRDALIAPDVDASKGPSSLQRVPSFSQVYPLRAGRGEVELNEQFGSIKPSKSSSQNRLGTGKTDLPSVTELEEQAATTFFTARTGHEIIRECQQNSLVPLMLSFLQAGLKPIGLPAASYAVGLGIDALPPLPSHRGYGYF